MESRSCSACSPEIRTSHHQQENRHLLHYLVSEAHLFFKSSQFERLCQISEHPIISKKIDTLFYEAEILTNYGSTEDWRTCICIPSWFRTLPPENHPSSIRRRARERRAYTRSMTRNLHAWKHYCEELLTHTRATPSAKRSKPPSRIPKSPPYLRQPLYRLTGTIPMQQPSLV